MGCTAEKQLMPGPHFVEEAKRPPPLYFETKDPTVQGTCCVCFKKGCLGRCPNPQCGLLMHHTCVMSTEPGGEQRCPICKTQAKLEEELVEDEDLPYWHEVEVGATVKRRKGVKPASELTVKKEGRLYPERSRPRFPESRWPSKEEASTVIRQLKTGTWIIGKES